MRKTCTLCLEEKDISEFVKRYNRCRTCYRENKRIYYSSTKEKRKIRRRESYLKNKDHELQLCYAWRQKNREKVSEQARMRHKNRTPEQVEKEKELQKIRNEKVQERKKRDPEYAAAQKEKLKIYQKEYRKNNPDLIKDLSKRCRVKKRIKYQEFMQKVKNLPCNCCGQKFPEKVLDFHHIDPKNKFMDISHMVSIFKPIEQILDEIKKCELLCANCHRMKTFNYI